MSLFSILFQALLRSPTAGVQQARCRIPREPRQSYGTLPGGGRAATVSMLPVFVEDQIISPNALV